MEKNNLRKVLVLGSGALKIGEAGEFDYSGSQAIKALKEEGIQIILVNPNIATVQTSEHLADKVYFLPVNFYFVSKIIEKERPQAILLSFGGQTALNCGIDLADKGILEKYDVKVLGTPIRAIKDTEDRERFVNKLGEINLKVPKGIAVKNTGEALGAAEKIGYPVIVRAAYTLGGKGSGVAYNKEELSELATRSLSSTNQILIEEYLKNWKEIEYEVVRDKFDNCITVCNMENVDPMGIHTGESIVVAPSQTLTNEDYHKLRRISIMAIRHLGIVGECNIQFALNPIEDDYRIIEVNARLSRSSAMASKATGYPLAFIAAKLALGYSLTDLENAITKVTAACFEPALDYCVVKIPRWDFQKFRKIKERIGSEMQSVGEVMAIGRNFEEALQKAIRMLQVGMYGLVCNKFSVVDIEDSIKNPTDKRIFVIAEALKNGFTIENISELSGIDKWFLYKFKNILEVENRLKEIKVDVPKELLLEAKQKGFSDAQIGIALGKKEMEIREIRKKHNIIPVIKQIDTLAAEYPAKTNYLYLTYNGEEDDISFEEKERKIIVLGSGAYSIGSSVEFDWCCVNSVLTLRKLGYTTIMINYNPETVSTDYDMCDRLYFDELSYERVMDIYEKENPQGIIISMGGQIPNNLAMKLHEADANIFGTSPLSIDNAEDRHKFSRLLDTLKIDQPEWNEFTNLDAAKTFAQKIGYPVLVRPSYVLSGSAMNVALNQEELETFLRKASILSEEHPVVLSKFITEAKEIELDAVANNGEIVTSAMIEHVENAGIHSGDSTMIFPPQKIYLETIRRAREIAQKIASSLKINGPFNIQFIAKDNEIKVIECNLRASRSFPFISKVSRVNFAEIATKVMLGMQVEKRSTLVPNYVGVKVPQFSFSRLKGADPILGVEMASTGEVACFGDDVHEAFLKASISTGNKIPRSNVLLSLGGRKTKYKFLESVKKLRELNFNIYATEHTSVFLKENGIENKMLQKIHEKDLTVIDYIKRGKIDLVINIVMSNSEKKLEDEYLIRRTAVDFGVPLLTNLQLADLFVESISKKKLEDLKIKSWDEYS